MSSLDDNLKIKIVELIENKDGSAEFQLEVDDDFRRRWMESENLVEWDEDKFKEFFIESVKKAVELDARDYKEEDEI